MSLGPGKYDEICTKARTEANATGVVLIVIDGKHGPGFSVQCSDSTLMFLPEMLENLAHQLRNDRAKLLLGQSAQTPN